ncbi:MAG: hypothetical protein HY922_12520 [Elusimicrobia bacterium]|nr:hypothetical protein [Elusimicrobiota bacterium]
MRNLFAVALASALASAAYAETPVVDFDQGQIDVSKIVAGLKDDVKKDEAQIKDIRPAYTHATRDCVDFVFEPNGPSVSPQVWLQSTEYVQECSYHGNPPTQHCWERPGFTHTERVQVEILNRQPVYPWEKEIVEVCLEGHWLSEYLLAAAYDYKVHERGGYITLTPGRRIPMNPDPAGIMAGNLVPSGAAFALGFDDRWASYYGGEQTSLKVALRENVPGWFDKTIVEKDISFPAAASYKVNFNDYLGEFNAKLKPGAKYYVKWGFKRLGSVSKPKFMDRGNTESVPFQPALEVASR